MHLSLVTSTSNESRVQAHLDSGREIELWLKANVELQSNADFWLFFMLPICMALKENLVVDASVTETAINAFHKAQDELLIAHPKLSRIELNTTKTQTQTYPEKRGIACFFSGGLDSTYTVKSNPEIDTLIAIRGFDIALSNQKHWDLSKALLEKYSEATGKKLILVESNIRALSNGILQWGPDYHGTALAAVANSLATQVSKVFVSASHIQETKRWGQFPSLSRALSTDYQQVVEFGSEPRTKKALALADEKETELMRVCYRNQKGMANCGKCQKCIRTRLEFELINAKYRPVGLEIKPSFLEIMNIKILANDFIFFNVSIDWAKDNGYPKTLAPRIAIWLARRISIVYFKLNPELKTKI